MAKSEQIDQQLAGIEQLVVLQRRAAELTQQRTEITALHAQQRAVRQAEHDAQLQRDTFAALGIADDPLRERLPEYSDDNPAPQHWYKTLDPGWDDEVRRLAGL